MSSILLMTCSAIFFTTLCMWILGFPLTYLLGIIGMVDDKNPLEGKCNGLSSTSWKSDYVCEHCLSFVSHEEQMTGICLSCGDRFDRIGDSVATRIIMYKGKWVRQLDLNGKIYLDKVLFEKEK